MLYTKGKYIVGDLVTSDGFEILTALLFNEVVQHDTFKHRFTKIYGAGFFHVHEDKVVVYGESISLGVKGRGEPDALQIRRTLGLEPKE